MNKMHLFIQLTALSLVLGACARTQESGGVNLPLETKKNQKTIESSSQKERNCSPDIEKHFTNLQIAMAFNQWRIKCNPTDEDLQFELSKL